MPVSPSDLRTVDDLLAEAFGRYSADHPKPQTPLLDAVVRRVVGQRTSRPHVDRAMANLRGLFRTWEEVLAADPDALYEALRPAGLARQKAAALRALLEQVYQERGEFSLEFLRDWATPEAYAYLKRLPGIGDLSAALVLLFAERRHSVMPVEGRILRACRRLGWVGPHEGLAAAQRAIEAAGQEMAMLDLHVNLGRLAHRHCHSGEPLCADCPLADLCPSFRPPWVGP